MMYLHDFLAPFPPYQEILIYQSDPRLPLYLGSIERLPYLSCKYMAVKIAEFSMGQLLVRVRHG